MMMYPATYSGNVDREETASLFENMFDEPIEKKFRDTIRAETFQSVNARLMDIDRKTVHLTSQVKISKNFHFNGFSGYYFNRTRKLGKH